MRKIEIPSSPQAERSESQPRQSTNHPNAQQESRAQVPPLPAEEQRYRTLIEQLPAILYISDYGADGRCYFISPKLKELLGHAPEEWIKDPRFWIEHLHPDDRVRALAEEEEARQSGKNLKCEYRLRHSNGTYLWFRDEAVPLVTRPGWPPVLHGVLYDIHATKMTEDALRQAEARYREVIEKLPAVAYIADFQPGAPWKYVSPQIATLLGVSQKEWLKKGGMWLAHVHPDDRELAKAATAQIRVQGGPFRMEYRMVRRDDRVVWVQDEGTAVNGPTGRAEFIHSILTDITERKTKEEELRESEQRLGLALEASGMGTFEMDARTGCLSWDDRGGELFQFPRQLSGRPFRELLYRIHPEDREAMVTKIEQALSTGRAVHFEFRTVLDDGSVEWRSVHGKAIRDASGEIVRLVGIGQGISERKQAEEALRRSEARYRALFEENVAALAIVAQDGRMVDCNQAFLQMHGYSSKDELRALRTEQLYANPQDRAKVLEMLKKQGRLENFEMQHRRKDGSVFWALRSVCPIENPEGGPPLLLGTAKDITVRKNAQAALAESRERLSLALEASGLSLWDLNVLTGEVYLDEQWSPMLGGPTQPTRTNVRELFAITHPEDRDRIFAEAMRVVQGKTEQYSADHRVRDGRGEWIWIHCTGKVIERDDEGKAIRAIGTNENITGRKEIEERLQESQERLQQTLNNAPLVMFSLDTQGTFLLSEGHGLEVLGLKPGEVVGRSIFELYRGEPGILSNFKRAMAGEEFVSIDRISQPRELTYETAWMPVRNAAGKIAGAAGVATDVSGRELAQRALRESEERLRLTLHAAGMGVWEWDSATNRVTWDVSLHRIFGVTPEEFGGQGRTLLELIHREDRQKFIDAKERAVRTGEMYQLDFRVIRPDGRMVWIADQGQPEFDATGKLLRYRGVARDVTRQRELQEQLQRAQKMEAIGQLAGGIAHDFNNLLTVIRGNTEALLEHAEGNPTCQQNAEAVMKAADRAAGITRQLLAYSRQQVMQPRVLELGGVVSETASLVRRLLGPAIRLDLQLAANSLYVRADANQLEQVVLNLVINARDAMPEGGTVTVSMDAVAKGSGAVRRYPQMRDGDYVRLRVQDTGTGMDAATQARVFEPFFTTKALGKGTGLGLATVYGIVKQSDGWIWVDSAPSKGTSFEVFLPEVAAPAEVQPAPLQRSTGLRGTETLLFVDDEEDVRGLLVEFLAGLGYQVISAGSGEEALEKIRAHSGDVHMLITDAQMPGMQGLELSRKLRELRPVGKILYISGYAEDTGILKHLPCKGEDFLQKPFGLTELATKIRELLRG